MIVTKTNLRVSPPKIKPEEANQKTKEFITFWEWFLKGSGDIAGYRRFINIWLLFHITIGLILTICTHITLAEVSNRILIPFIGLFIVSLFWGGTHILYYLQSTEIKLLSKYKKGGFLEYVYLLQLSTLVIIMTILLWGIAGLGIFDKDTNFSFSMKFFLFFISSHAVREIWHTILGAYCLLIIQNKIAAKKD